MIGEEKLHVCVPNRVVKPLSRNNQAHPKDKSSTGQSLSVALSASWYVPVAIPVTVLEPDSETTMTTAAIATAKRPDQDATTTSPDLTALKMRQQAAWSSGDYAVVGTTLQIVGEELCEALNLRPGRKVLDVAAGNGLPVWPPRGAGATLYRRTMCRACWSAVAHGHRLKG